MVIGSNIIDFDGKRWVLNKNSLTPIEQFADISGVKRVVTDFDGAMFDVETIAGPPSHAAPLIERRLRDQGVLDSAGRVLIHHTAHTGGTTTAFYSAISAKTFGAYHDEAEQQKDHCLLLPVASLLYRYLLSSKDKSGALIFRQSRYLYLLIVVDGEVVGATQALGFSSGVEDMRPAVENLVEQLNRIEKDTGYELDSITWLNWAEAESEGDDLPLFFEEKSGISIEMVAQKSLFDGAVTYQSSLDELLACMDDADAANDASGRVFLKIEKFLPIAVVLLISCCAGLFGANLFWSEETKRMEAKLQSSEVAGVRASIAEIGSRLPPTLPPFVSSKEMTDLYGFLDRLNRNRLIIPLQKVLHDVDEARPDEVEISGITFTSDYTGVTIVLDGHSDAELLDATRSFDRFGNELAEQGYMIANSTQGEKQKKPDDFQLNLTLEKSND